MEVYCFGFSWVGPCNRTHGESYARLGLLGKIMSKHFDKVQKGCKVGNLLFNSHKTNFISYPRVLTLLCREIQHLIACLVV